MKKIGLRIDVDTWRGTQRGVPNLLALLKAHQLQASFFFTVGPDNMGRHLWRLLKPHNVKKMLRSQAASMYGWNILLAGTAWPGKAIGEGLANIIRRTAENHEWGLHAWDHFAWQTWAGIWPHNKLLQQMTQGCNALTQITGSPVTCSAAASWRADNRVVEAKQPFGFRYNSDCRGTGPFLPLLSNGQTGTVQVPVTLPVWGEVVGQQVDALDYNTFILKRMVNAPGSPVYTIHAESEGIVGVTDFADLLRRAGKSGIQFCPLSELIPEDLSTLPVGEIVRGHFAGREGDEILTSKRS